MKTLTEADVTFELIPEDEDTDPSEQLEGESLEFAREGGWHWFAAHVVARWTDAKGRTFTGDDYLGGCSYRSEEDFRADEYFSDMKTVALADLNEQVRSHCLHEAAPDLLDALIHARRLLAKHGYAQFQIDAAIAKATGEGESK